jgi:hypothetical protein
VSTIKIPAEYEHFYWVFCLSCNEPMFGMERPCPQSDGTEWTCGHCDTVNVFRDSLQPVEVLCASAPPCSHSICTQDNLMKSSENQTPQCLSTY